MQTTPPNSIHGMKLAIEISDATDLAPKDGSASCNPYVEVEFDDQRQRTATKSADGSPYWNQTLVFDVRNPARFPFLLIDVSVFHDRRLQDYNALRPHIFLGRVRINAASVVPSAQEAVLQRYPLEKRGLFSRVSGDIALRMYLIQNPIDASAAAAAVNTNHHQQQQSIADAAASRGAESIVRSAFAAARPEEQSASARGKSNHYHEPRPRIFHSVQASGPPPQAGDQQQPRRAMLHAVAGDRRSAAAKIATTYDLLKPTKYLYVNVIKARDLPNKDITGALDPFVEVKLGNFKGMTKYLQKNPNPVWRQTFAFSHEHIQSTQLEVVVMDKDTIKDDFVGRVLFDMADIPQRVPPDGLLAPQWYSLTGHSGEKLRHGEIMLTVWIGTQADEAFPEALHSDAHSLPLDVLASTRSKVYYSPKLTYLKVTAIEAQDLEPAEKGRPLAPTIAKIQLGGQTRRTRPGKPQGPAILVWNEDFMFVAGEPFDEPLVVTVEERVAAGRDEPLGRVIVPVAAPHVPRNDLAKSVEPKWFNLSRTLTVDAATVGANKDKRFTSKIRLQLSLETAYHVLDESTHYSSDLQPSAKKLCKGPIGILELGILGGAVVKAKEGRLADPYCVAKYGPKWVRTRTVLNTLDPQWNEQHTWEVFDPCTVITVAMFDNIHVSGGGGEGSKDQRIGRVRIRLSTLEVNRVYTHLYPLVALTPSSGLKKTGELHLAVRFTCTSRAKMLGMYGRPLLPKMHYTNPIPVLQVEYLRFQAMQMVAVRLGRTEPPLRREVVEYMLDVDSHMFSLRRSKANFKRIESLFLGAVAAGNWLDGVCRWKNTVTTVLVHVLFLILVCYPELILPTVFLYLSMIGVWNYRLRQREPPAHMDTVLSHAEPGMVHPDELDEELDTFPTSKPGEVVGARYDRLRSVAGRVQTVLGDLATQGERAQELLSWRDPRATAIFTVLSLVLTVVLFVMPFQVVAVVAGLYLLRHPRFRSNQPSVPFNFYKRLPAKSDMML